jgi:hypothetical protein
MMLAFINEIGQELEGAWASSLRCVRIPLCKLLAIRKNSFNMRSNSSHCVAFIGKMMFVQHFLLNMFNVHRIYT